MDWKACWTRTGTGTGDGVDKALIAPDNLFINVSQADGLRIEDDELIRH